MNIFILIINYMTKVNKKYIICLDEPTYFSKNFEIDSRDDTCHGSEVVMFLFYVYSIFIKRYYKVSTRK